MKRILPILSVVMLSGCVAISTNWETVEDNITGREYYSFEVGLKYPKKRFVTAKEYHETPESMRDVLYKSYKEREKIEEDWSNFINNCLLSGTLDC